MNLCSVTHLQQLLLLGGRWQLSDAQVPLLHAVADAQVAAWLQRVAVEQADGGAGQEGRGVLGVGEASVLPAEVHHEAELPQGPHRAEEGDQLVLVGVPGDLADEDLTAGSWTGPVPTSQHSSSNSHFAVNSSGRPQTVAEPLSSCSTLAACSQTHAKHSSVTELLNIIWCSMERMG